MMKLLGKANGRRQCKKQVRNSTVNILLDCVKDVLRTKLIKQWLERYSPLKIIVTKTGFLVVNVLEYEQAVLILVSQRRQDDLRVGARI